MVQLEELEIAAGRLKEAIAGDRLHYVVEMQEYWSRSGDWKQTEALTYAAIIFGFHHFTSRVGDWKMIYQDRQRALSGVPLSLVALGRLKSSDTGRPAVITVAMPLLAAKRLKEEVRAGIVI